MCLVCIYIDVYIVLIKSLLNYCKAAHMPYFVSAHLHTSVLPCHAQRHHDTFTWPRKRIESASLKRSLPSAWACTFQLLSHPPTNLLSTENARSELKNTSYRRGYPPLQPGQRSPPHRIRQPASPHRSRPTGDSSTGVVKATTSASARAPTSSSPTAHPEASST